MAYDYFRCPSCGWKTYTTSNPWNMFERKSKDVDRCPSCGNQSVTSISRDEYHEDDSKRSTSSENDNKDD